MQAGICLKWELFQDERIKAGFFLISRLFYKNSAFFSRKNVAVFPNASIAEGATMMMSTKTECGGRCMKEEFP